MVAVKSLFHGVAENRCGIPLAVLDAGLEARHVRLIGLLIGARRGEVQVHQLKPRFQILRGRRTVHRFLKFADGRADRRDLARELLAQLNGVILAPTALGKDARRHRRREVILVRHQAVAAGTERRQQHLVVLERRRLEQHMNAVGQHPFRRVHLFVPLLGDNFSRHRRLGHQGRIRQPVRIRGKLRPLRRP